MKREPPGAPTAHSSGPSVRSSQPADAADDLLADLKALRYDVLFPVSRWLRDRPWEFMWVRALIFFALFPAAVLVALRGHSSLRDSAWVLGVYFALLWGAVLYWAVRPSRVVGRQVVGVAGFTAIIGVFVLLAVQRIPPFNLLYWMTQAPLPLIQLPSFIVGVGGLEEFTKAVPVLWLVLRARAVSTPREAAFLGGVSGLAFGVAEGVHYSFVYASGNFVGALSYGDYLLIQTLRMVSLPFLHCIWSAICGYYIGLAALSPRQANALVAVGIASMAMLHGSYDFFSSGLGGLLIFAFSILVFVSYARSADEIASALATQARRAPALSPGSSSDHS